jgi:hypothetical protein
MGGSGIGYGIYRNPRRYTGFDAGVEILFTLILT